MCNLNDREDEFNLILKSPIYMHLYSLYVKKYYWRNASIFKLVQLVSVYKRQYVILENIFKIHNIYIFNIYNELSILHICAPLIKWL